MASSSAEWEHVFAFVSIFWLTSVVSVASTEQTELKIWPSGPARCGENMKLLCYTSSSHSLTIKSFSWVRNTTLCEYKGDDLGHKDRCERKNDTLILNLINITSADEGEYICKLRAKEGVKDADFNVTIKACSIRSRAVIPTIITTTPRKSSGSLVRSDSARIAVGIVMVNLMIYC